jgi:hypothetical protein
MSNFGHFGGGGNCIRRFLQLALKTWVSRPGFQDSDRQNQHGRIGMAQTVNRSERPVR